jgi:L-ascorbate metabolism protein UlaG (beta-lactamase superfamily)
VRLTKYTHACVRLDDGDRALVIDPGMWSESTSLDGADAVLITHEHRDHVDPDGLAAFLAANPSLRIYTHADVAAQLDKLADAVTVVAAGDEFTAAGFQVRAVGGEHAEIHDGLPGCANLGYLIGTPAGVLYHPGDSLWRPEIGVDVLLVPVSGPWLKLGEAIDFVAELSPRLAFPIHEAVNSLLGNQLVDGWLSDIDGQAYQRIDPGKSVELSG